MTAVAIDPVRGLAETSQRYRQLANAEAADAEELARLHEANYSSVTSAEIDLTRNLAEATAELGRDADIFLHLYPFAGEGWGFQYPHPCVDLASGMVYHFRFICDGSARKQDVIRVLFVDYTTEPFA